MHDPMTFERRLADALEQYNVGAPVQVDSAALASELAARSRGRGPLRLQWPSRTVRLVLVAGLLALAVVSGLIAAGMWPDRSPLVEQTQGRLMVWMPTSSGSGTTYMYNSAGDLQWTRQIGSRGCPRLLADGLMAMGDFGRIRIETDAGVHVQDLDVSYAGGERWAPDGRAVALVDMEDGPVTVVRFGIDSTPYDLAGAIEAVVSNGGERVVVAVRTGDGADLHLLDGRDTLVYRHPSPAESGLSLALAPDGSRVAVVDSGPNGEPQVTVVSLPDGNAITTGPSVEPGVEFYPISWSPDGSTLALRYGSGVYLYDAAGNTWRDSGMYFHTYVETSRWLVPRAGPLGLAMLGGNHLDVYRDGNAEPTRLVGDGPFGIWPDRMRVASLENIDPASTRAKLSVHVGTFEISADGDDLGGRVATLPADHPPISSDGQLRPCLNWMP